jgi:digeranylgeranylglycerophospholipid reductase
LEYKTDVIIVGAGTAGSYLAWLLGKKGVGVTLIEKDKKEEVGKRLDIIHFESDRIQKAGIPPFKVGDPDCVEIRDRSYVSTPDFSRIIEVAAYQTIVRLTPFLNKMHSLLEKESVKLEFSTTFKNLLLENGKITGIKAMKEGKEITLRAKLVIDASGTSAVVRTSLPQDYGIETFTLGPNDVMYVLLEYIKWKNPDLPHPKADTSYIYWLLWFGPSFSKDEAILGVGQPGSFENARLAREDFLKQANLPPYEIIKKEQGFTPYRRPLYSLVADGLLCVGDAAAITYPFSGHGVTATWMLDIIAADTISNTINEKASLTKEDLWEINVNYFRDQGAKFAGLFMQLSGVLNFTEKEWTYFLKNNLIYKSGDKEEIPEPNKEYEQEMGFGEMITFIGKIIVGLIGRKLSLRNIRHLLKANGLSSKIKKHYGKYPAHPQDIKSWVVIADELWSQKKIAHKKLSTITIEYH